MKKTYHRFVLMVATILMLFIFTSCSNDSEGIPVGQYEPTDTAYSTLYPSIAIKGSDFTITSFEAEQMFKYTYKDGIITLIDDEGFEVRIKCTFEDGVLTYDGVEFEKAG